ncbi:hypothetical protein FHG08_11550 [Pseudoalteromonas sp. Scap03]|nr:hypothetical protein [Pseudoalteromonas sp. Scap03]QLE81444.1 hypothetical protein FLM54_07805 [Pseudoalteromonas sp. Scap25]QLE89388.1 hypothetical protein FLM47_07800 [Pseudoalteromonas sp. Scap06]
MQEQENQTNQQSELTTSKTVLAQAMEGLRMGSVSSSAAHSPDSQQSQGLDDSEPERRYSELDSFINGDDSETDGETNETESEEMSEQDAAIAAGFFVDTGAGFIESQFDYPVTIDNDTRVAIAEAAAPVLLKNAKGANLPPWVQALFVKYKEEMKLLGVLAMAGLSIRGQIKAAKEELNAQKSEQKSEKQYDKSGEVTIGY